jgi:alanine racemase
MPGRVEINLDALVRNWRRLKDHAGGARTCAVVKANAYGLGAGECARALMEAGCDRFYVAWLEEGVALRKALGRGPEIAVFHGPPTPDFSAFREHGLTPVLNSLEHVEAWKAAGADRPPAALHLDTGMNRLGLSRANWGTASITLGGLKPQLLVSHLASGDEADSPMNARQRAAFNEARALWPGIPCSLSATGGILLGRDYTFDEVRPGIGLYGGGPDAGQPGGAEPVVRLLAPILQVRDCAAGESVGYGSTYTLKSPARIATIGLGYADGFLRSGSNQGICAIGGALCPVIGRVSMDLITVDVTHTDAGPGDEAEFLGPTVALLDQAKRMSTIEYELLTRLGDRLPRRYVRGG